MKAMMSRRRTHKSSPKCSAESTRCSRVFLRRCRNPGPRRNSAARIQVYPPERILDRILDRVAVDIEQRRRRRPVVHSVHPPPLALGETWALQSWSGGSGELRGEWLVSQTAQVERRWSVRDGWLFH